MPDQNPGDTMARKHRFVIVTVKAHVSPPVQRRVVPCPMGPVWPGTGRAPV
jgi:hypothetical protein